MPSPEGISEAAEALMNLDADGIAAINIREFGSPPSDVA
jgi:hypothetical protein